VRRFNDLGNIMNGDIQKIVDEPALVTNMEKLKEASEVFK
jgi:peptide chain release factor 1